MRAISKLQFCHFVQIFVAATEKHSYEGTPPDTEQSQMQSLGLQMRPKKFDYISKGPDSKGPESKRPLQRVPKKWSPSKFGVLSVRPTIFSKRPLGDTLNVHKSRMYTKQESYMGVGDCMICTPTGLLNMVARDGA